MRKSELIVVLVLAGCLILSGCEEMMEKSTEKPAAPERAPEPEPELEPEPEPEPELEPDHDLAADREILLATQYVLHGDGLGWDVNLPIDEWEGVSTGGGIGENPNRVTGLGLGSRGLTGEVPESLGNLSQLRFLDLSYNDLTGGIPASLGNLSQLRSLHLAGSGLSGCIPTALRSNYLESSGQSSLDWYSYCDEIPEPLPEPDSEFDIDVHILGLTAFAIGRTAANGRSSGRVSVVRDEIGRAVTWWESKITGDLPDEAITSSLCGRSVEWFIEGGPTIDDLAVIVEIGEDDPFTAATAYVCETRTVGGLPILARVVIQKNWLLGVGISFASLGLRGNIERVMRHELGHALGFIGEVFAGAGLARVANGHRRFTGTTARAWFPQTNLPWALDDVQEHGVPLTSDGSHLPFPNQIMSSSTAWVEEGTLTLAIMADLGYGGVIIGTPHGQALQAH